MNRFFKNIRHTLFINNRFTKYALYAIGEIVLLVIGILIALQISNWNESKKQNQYLQNIYSVIIEDLESDSIEFDSILTDLNSRKEIFDKIKARTLTRDYLFSTPITVRMVTGFPDFSIQTRGYELLKANPSNDNIRNELHTGISDFYKRSIIEIESDQDWLSDDLRQNYAYWKLNFDWFGDYIENELPEGFIEYAIN